MAGAAKSPNSEKPRSERELKVTAALYAMLGVVPYLKEHGRLPDRIGGPWNYIPARILLQQRGPDLELTDDERLVYEAILREGRLPGGSVILLDEHLDPQPAAKTKRKKRA